MSVATLVLFATVGVLNVGAAVSTRTVYGCPTVVTGVDSLSVTLKVTVFRPTDRTTGIDHATLCNAGVATDCHWLEPTLYPIDAILVLNEPALALAIPLNVTRVVFAYSVPDSGTGDVTLRDGAALTVVTDEVPLTVLPDTTPVPVMTTVVPTVGGKVELYRTDATSAVC